MHCITAHANFNEFVSCEKYADSYSCNVCKTVQVAIYWACITFAWNRLYLSCNVLLFILYLKAVCLNITILLLWLCRNFIGWQLKCSNKCSDFLQFRDFVQIIFILRIIKSQSKGWDCMGFHFHFMLSYFFVSNLMIENKLFLFMFLL